MICLEDFCIFKNIRVVFLVLQAAFPPIDCGYFNLVIRK